MTKNIKRPGSKGGAHVPAPATDTQGSTNLEYPVFCLRYLGNLGACATDEKAALADTMRNLSQLTWQQIISAPRKGLGFEKIPVGQIRGECVPQFAKDKAFLLAFRFAGNAPLLGVREGATLRILHLDRDFTAYDHG